jgi:hypothetical protein
MARKAPADKRKVIARRPLGEDLELHVSRCVVAGEIVVDIRRYVPSIDTYGRGTTYPFAENQAVIKALGIIGGPA